MEDPRRSEEGRVYLQRREIKGQHHGIRRVQEEKKEGDGDVSKKRGKNEVWERQRSQRRGRE